LIPLLYNFVFKIKECIQNLRIHTLLYFMLTQLQTMQDIAMQNEFFSLRINKNNIDNYFAQQILICSQKLH